MKEDQGYYVAESKQDFTGMEIVYIEHWKEGVKRIHTRKALSPSMYGFYMIYASDDIAEKLQEGETVS